METILDYLQSLPGLVKVVLCFTLLPIYLFRDSIGFIIKKIEPKSLLSKKAESFDFNELLMHDFFMTLKEIQPRVAQVDFSDDGELNEFKRTMMINLIGLKTESVANHFKLIINTLDIGSVSTQEFKFIVVSGIQELIKEYNAAAVTNFQELGVSNVDAHYFVDSYEKYRETIINSFVDRLDSICTSRQYSTNYSRMLAMLEVLTVAVEVIPRDVKSLYLIINGRYDKYNKKLN